MNARYYLPEIGRFIHEIKPHQRLTPLQSPSSMSRGQTLVQLKMCSDTRRWALACKEREVVAVGGGIVQFIAHKDVGHSVG
jgi:hypothetical protein